MSEYMADGALTGERGDIVLEDVWFSYGDRQVLKGLSWRVDAGSTVALLGRNGSGKTTTLSLLTGQLAGQKGRISMGSMEISPEAKNAKRLMAFVPSVHEIYDYLTGEEYVEFVCGLWGIPRAEARDRATKWFERFDLGDRKHTIAGDYSHGMQQRLVLIAALTHEPQLLVLDEPLVGLDIDSATTLKSVLAERKTMGETTILSTHLLETVRDITDQVAIIHDGRLVADGTLADIENRLGVSGTEHIFRTLTGDSR